MSDAPETPVTDGTDTPAGADESAPVTLKRRDALRVLAAAATLPVLDGLAAGEVEAQGAAPRPAAPPAAPATQAPTGVTPGPRGTLADPDLLHPRANWPRRLTNAEMVTITALCDVIIPADEKSPSASAVGAPSYVNEHVSAPYDGNQRDLVRVRGGIAWLNLESRKRFSRDFARLTATQKTAICDDICYLPNAKPEFRAAARFFDLIRDLTATAFYTTDAGMKDIGYVGNVAMPRFDPPPPAVLRQLGLE